MPAHVSLPARTDNRLAGRLERLTRLPAKGPASDSLIHELRVAGKRLRAYLRLFCPALGKKEVRRWDRKLSRCLKTLAAHRNAMVLQKLAKKLNDPQLQKTLPPAGFKKSQLQKIETVLATLQKASDLLIDDALRRTKEKQLHRALHKSFQQSAKRQEEAKGRHSGPLLHRWRKSVKRCLYQIQLLAPHRKKDLKRLQETEDALGKIHDRDELLSFWKESGRSVPKKRLLKTISKQQKKQARKAFQRAPHLA